MKDWTQCTGFEWNEGNSDKNWQKHAVTDSECENIFFNQPLIVGPDPEHSASERRFRALGRTDHGRKLLVIFTVRGMLIRVISARDMTRKERDSMPHKNMKKLKSLPALKSEDEEREFWVTHDSMDYVDWDRAERVVFPNLKPSLRSISLRLPVSMIEGLKSLANKRDIPYQSLLKVFLAERLEQERR